MINSAHDPAPSLAPIEGLFLINPDSVEARTLTQKSEKELYVDPSMTGTGTTALGLNPYNVSGGVLAIHAAPTPNYSDGVDGWR